MHIEFSTEAHSLLRKLGERAITLEFSLQFGSDLVKKDAIAYPGPAPADSDFEQIFAEGVEVWWRQRISTGLGRLPTTTTKLRPKKVHLRSDGYLFEAVAQYA